MKNALSFSAFFLASILAACGSKSANVEAPSQQAKPSPAPTSVPTQPNGAPGGGDATAGEPTSIYGTWRADVVSDFDPATLSLLSKKQLTIAIEKEGSGVRLLIRRICTFPSTTTGTVWTVEHGYSAKLTSDLLEITSTGARRQSLGSNECEVDFGSSKTKFSFEGQTLVLKVKRNTGTEEIIKLSK